MNKSSIKNVAICILLAYSIAVSLLYDFSIDNCCEKEYDSYLGRIVGTSIRFPNTYMQNFTSKNLSDSTDVVLEELINNKNIWGSFQFDQKKEFILICLIYGDLQGGSLAELLILAGPESKRISDDLNKISNKILRDKFNLSDEGISNFRNKIAFLQGE